MFNVLGDQLCCTFSSSVDEPKYNITDHQDRFFNWISIKYSEVNNSKIVYKEKYEIHHENVSLKTKIRV